MPENNIKNIIEELKEYNQFEDIGIDQIVDLNYGYAFKIAQFLKNEDLRTIQLKGYLEYIERIERLDKKWDEKKIEFYLLKPRLAMGVAKNRIPQYFFDVIIVAMDLVDVSDDETQNLKNFKYFVYFIESIIAYHKFLGGQ